MDLSRRIKQITSYNLFEMKTEKEEIILPCKEFFTAIENYRTEKVCQMTKIYETFGPILKKLENLVLTTNTGKSIFMQYYYNYWESQIYQSMTNMIITNLDAFTDRMQKNKAIYQINVDLMVPEVILYPTATETYNIVLKDMRDFLDKLRLFGRWMDQTCLICAPQKIPGTDDYFLYSFYEDILQVPDVNDSIFKLQTTTHRTVLEVHKYKDIWRRYKNLWSFDKEKTCELFLEQNAVLAKYDEKLVFYMNIIKELGEKESFTDIGCIRVNQRPLMNAICDHALQWKNILGEMLANDTKTKMDTFKKDMDELTLLVNLNIKGLESFKNVLQALNTILKSNVDAEVKYLTFQQTYEMLGQHEISFPAEDETLSYQVGRIHLF